MEMQLPFELPNSLINNNYIFHGLLKNRGERFASPDNPRVSSTFHQVLDMCHNSSASLICSVISLIALSIL